MAAILVQKYYFSPYHLTHRTDFNDVGIKIYVMQISEKIVAVYGLICPTTAGV